MAHIDNQTRTLEEETAAEARENEQVEDEDEAAAEAARVNEALRNLGAPDLRSGLDAQRATIAGLLGTG
jgi:hypothetical protein